jgi:putative transposase
MRSETPSFVTELPLKTTSADEATILVRLDAGRQLYHACLGEALECLAYIQQLKEYQAIKKLPKTINGEPNKERTKAFNELNKKEGFTDYAIQHYATGIRNSWMEEHIHAHIAQKLATRAFKAVQKKAFGIAKNVRFKGKNQMDSLEGKEADNGLIFRDNTLLWAGLKIPCIVDTENDVIAYGLHHKLKYCRIVRRVINRKNRFYLQLILEGTPYQNPKNKIGTEEIGLDVGVGTIATVADTKATLKQFCSELIPDQKKKRKLQRKLDRSLRATNPDNYNPNGTVKKGKKFKKSNRYKTISQDLAETDRILAAHRKSLHGKDINEIIATGTQIKTENVSYKGWQKRYGRSIGMRAPSMFMDSLKRKAENAGGYFFEIPTQTTKLSQTCHICEQAVKKRLSKRWHICCGIQMQRDLYSAYLAKCVGTDTSALDFARAKDLWQGMESILSEAISRAKETAIGKVCPASFGFNGIQSQSGSLVNPVRIISEAMDAVILPDESHRELI